MIPPRTELPDGKRLSDNVDLRPIAGSKIFVYMSQYKQKKTILFVKTCILSRVTATATKERRRDRPKDKGETRWEQTTIKGNNDE